LSRFKLVPERALEHENPLIVQSSANFIVSAKGKDVIPTLLTHKNGYVRSGAVLGLNGLKNIKPQSRINILSAALTDEWVSVRDLAAKTLQEIGSTDATDALVEALKHHDSVIRYSIAEALRQLLSDAGIEALERILADQDLDYAIRVTTASALNFATINPQILSILNTVFHEDKNPNVCIQVISTLKETRDAEQLLPRFSELRLRISEIQATGMLGEMAMANDVLDAIATIQSRCKFYNYEFEEERKAVIIQTEGERSTNQPVTNNYTAEVIQFIEKNKGTIIGKSDHKAE
jgi:HEAT repeat protein